MSQVHWLSLTVSKLCSQSNSVRDWSVLMMTSLQMMTMNINEQTTRDVFIKNVVMVIASSWQRTRIVFALNMSSSSSSITRHYVVLRYVITSLQQYTRHCVVLRYVITLLHCDECSVMLQTSAINTRTTMKWATDQSTSRQLCEYELCRPIYVICAAFDTDKTLCTIL